MIYVICHVMCMWGAICHLWHPGEESAQLHHEQQQGLTLCAIANTYYLSINLIECYCLWDLGFGMSDVRVRVRVPHTAAPCI